WRCSPTWLAGRSVRSRRARVARGETRDRAEKRRSGGGGNGLGRPIRHWCGRQTETGFEILEDRHQFFRVGAAGMSGWEAITPEAGDVGDRAHLLADGEEH